MDLWRLPEGKIAELVDLPSVFAEAVSLIEWPQKLGALMPSAYLDVELRMVASPEVGEEDDDAPREAVLTAVGDAWAQRLAGIAEGA